MSAAVLDLGWWLERLTPSETEDGPNFYVCPAHGGGSLHVEEKNGKALVSCFGCQATYAELVAAAEAQEGKAEEDAGVAPSEPGPTITFGRKKAAGAPAVTTSVTALDWTAQRCGMTRADLDAMALPLAEEPGWVVFEFAGSARVKKRGVVLSAGKQKAMQWAGEGGDPPIWPVPTAPGSGEATDFVLCEGEFDAIALRCAGWEAYTITGGSTNVPDESAFRYMKDAGWERCLVLFDDDPAGRKGRDAVLEAIRAADIETATAKVKGINPLLGEKDARDVAMRIGAKSLELEYADERVKTVPIASIANIQPEGLLLGHIHPREHTILYGDGSAGKGVVAAWWVARLAAEEGKRVLVVDYESHAEYEWRPRLGAMMAYEVAKFQGAAAGTLSSLMQRVFILTPGMKPIWELQDWLRDQAKRVDADILVIDSVTYACIKDAEVSETAIRYSHAVAALKLPVLSIAHVTKADANPKHPFGSVYWSNGARVTYALSRTDPNDDAKPRLLKNWKSNQRHRTPDETIDWSWVVRDGPPDHLDFMDVKLSQAQHIAQARHDLAEELGVDEASIPARDVAARASEYADVPVSDGNVRAVKRRGARGASIAGKNPKTLAAKGVS